MHTDLKDFKDVGFADYACNNALQGQQQRSRQPTYIEISCDCDYLRETEKSRGEVSHVEIEA